VDLDWGHVDRIVRSVEKLTQSGRERALSDVFSGVYAYTEGSNAERLEAAKAATETFKELL